MARPRLSFPAFNNLPFTFIASQLVQDNDFRVDILGIARMPDEQFVALSGVLASFPTFLDNAEVKKIFAQSIPSGGRETAALVCRLNSLLRGSSDSAEQAVRLLLEKLSKHDREFPEDVIRVLRERLTALILTPRGFGRQKKAEMLAEATGAELADFSIICDVRPVFDNERKVIEGALALTTLRLELVQPDGNVSPVECRLTEAQLERLGRTVDTARGKLSAIKQLLEKKEVPLAKTIGVINDGRD